MKRFGEKRVCLVSGRERFSLGGAREDSEVGGGKMNFCGSDFMLLVLLEVLQVRVGGQGEGEGERKRERESCLLYTSPSPRDATLSRMPSSA